MPEQFMKQFPKIAAWTIVGLFFLGYGWMVLVLVRSHKQPIGHRYGVELTVTGTGLSWTNTDGTVWTELKFTQKPMVTTPVYEQTNIP